MERSIYIEPLQKRFVLELKDANKASRNRSYANASDCCGVKLKQEKRCSVCNAEVASSDCKRKIVKIGKEEHLIGADALEQVTESLDREQLSVGVFLKEMPQGASDRIQGVMYGFPVDKKESQYKELAELLKGRVAVAKGVVRNNELQILLTVGDDGVIRFTQLVEESQRYPFSPQEVAQKLERASLNPQVISVEQKILDKKTVDSYDVTEFRDSRLAREEKVIEEYVLNGTVPEIVKEVRQAEEQDELARLQALAN